ncbi:DNA (cytosine-5-)-methyltransferase [Gemella haemolysans]|uniref:DNA (Cytosine-5-)-methyltransferase n=1 Tax=Gemella haemolysans TaxID=1379 RepID=A0A133ZS36_9BACL|nr:site-specific DNA-methyltransferase [Gemella haemolysans]KXB58245.1 DNA (cytosine-5-)-methyltransferase [Gemella haemolysans]
MKKELENLLLQHEEFLVEGILNKNKLSELARKYDAKLLNVLMKEEKIKNHFFSELEEGILVFKKDVFLQFINNKEFLPDSFTAYKTKIGLGSRDGSLLSENHDIVLNFPYKDCILEGGQTKEDAKRDEIFFNETLAPKEITKLLDDKVFTNFKRYDKDGEHEVKEIKEDDNFIIKGNNLVVLHSLKKKYAGKVKCIYIDPPYNTGSDSFGYNDRFNHSTWLTFMANRIDAAKELLSNDGIMFVHCDDNEQAYLKVLMDEKFQKNNFIGNIVYRKRKSQANLSKNISSIHEYILIYRKTDQGELKKVIPKFDITKFKNPDNDPRGPYDTNPCTNKGGSVYPITTPTGKTIVDEWRFTEETFNKLLEDNRIVFPNKGMGKPRYKKFLEEKKQVGIIPNTMWGDIIEDRESEEEEIETWWDDLATNQDANIDLKKLFNDTVFAYPKAEDLIKRILEISTEERDLVLDFHLGSGTTAAVAHKMNRQYIGIEQMEYIESVTVERMKKVITGEQGGISKDVNWQGGGEFVYCELKNDAEDFKNSIIESQSTGELIELFNLARKSSFLSYRVEPKKLKEREFLELSFAEQKQLLLEIIDQNNLYVNFSDIDDDTYRISEYEKKLNKEFYGGE